MKRPKLICIIILLFLIVVLNGHFVAAPFLVRGWSMEPNIEDGDRLIVDKISYCFREPKRGDVIVFKYPDDPLRCFIKRIIGLPGEEIKIEGQKVFVINRGVEIEIQEDYLPEKVFMGSNLNINLGEDEYFVLGDNRILSFDSRQWGALPKKSYYRQGLDENTAP